MPDKRIYILQLALFLCLTITAQIGPFSTLDTRHGLSDNQVQYIMQLPDGRMLFTTHAGMNLYDGAQCRYIHRNDSNYYHLSGYRGAYHLYADNQNHLWVKTWQSLWAIDLEQECYIAHPEKMLKQMGVNDSILDLYIDSRRCMWIVTPQGVWNSRNHQYITLPRHLGVLQDVESEGERVYFFTNKGYVACYDMNDRRLLYTSQAYPASEEEKYKNTSLVVRCPKGMFYQLRCGTQAACFAFNPDTRKWEKLLSTPYVLHTIIAPSGNNIIISCRTGLWTINVNTKQCTYKPSLPLVDGQELTTDINTICEDRAGGMWLGTAHKGVYYTHPQRFHFHSEANINDFHTPHLTQWAANIQGTTHLVDKKGNTWQATQDGLLLIEAHSKKKRIYRTEDGLVNNYVHALVEDKQGYIWATTSYGISRLRLNEKNTITCDNFLTEDGTLACEYLDARMALLPNGYILAQGTEGYTLFHPDSVEIPRIELHPTLTSIALHGSILTLPVAPPYLKYLELKHHDNTLTFNISALNYAFPRRTYYRYRLMKDGHVSTWNIVNTHTANGMTDNNGQLHLTFASLTPGDYTLQVMASTHPKHWKGDTYSLQFVIHAPWWKTTWAYTLYTLLVMLLLIFVTWLYVKYTQEKMKQKHKEEMLLMRIQTLIEQSQLTTSPEEENASSTNNYTSEENCHSTEKDYSKESSKKAERDTPKSEAYTRVENEFLQKAIALVETHLSQPDYTVEQLAKDLCMERTGLYKKLNAMLDKSPSMFMRTIRLRRAAQLIKETQKSMADIAMEVGFSSSSYMSKCFQEEYGCKPSEYKTLNTNKKSDK